MRLITLQACMLWLAGISYATEIPVPDGAIHAVRQAGIDTITNTISNINKLFTDAVEAFKPINATCTSLLAQEVQGCSSCVKAKCEARAKSVCEPDKWQKYLGKAVEGVKDVHKFLIKKVPDFIVKELPNKIIDVTKDIHEFLKDKVLDNVVDVGKKLGDGVIDITKGLGKGVLNAGESTVKEIGRFGERVGKEAGRVLESAGKEIGRFGEKVGKEIGRAWDKIWGKRRRSVFVRRSAGEPGCGDFESNASEACKVYLQSNFCPPCGFDPMTKCPGYAAALQKITDAEKSREWMLKITSHDYNILSMKFSMGPQGQFVNVKATVTLFGKRFEVNVGETNPYLPDQAGPAIASAALNLFIQSA